MDESREKWLPVVGYEGHYEVSDRGRVRSLDRVVPHKRFGTQKTQGRVMSQKVENHGYWVVSLRKDGTRKWNLTHRLVLLAFRGTPKEGEETRHLDDDKLNCDLENLVWGSRSENLIDRQRNGIEYFRNLEACPLGHPLSGDNLLPSQLGYGRGCRSCLACNRARANLKANPDYKPYLKEVADIHLANIFGEKKRLRRRDVVSMLNLQGIRFSEPR